MLYDISGFFTELSHFDFKVAAVPGRWFEAEREFTQHYMHDDIRDDSASNETHRNKH
jgi:hypothetical protein